jgi:hypothetical protein
MNFSITTEYSEWWILICLLVSFLITFFLYRRSKIISELKKWQKILLYSLRFIFIFFLTFLILTPVIKNLKRTVMQPLVIFVQDNSSSLLMTKDSLFMKKEYTAEINKLLNATGEKYELFSHDFGSDFSDSLSFLFDDKQTNISMIADEIEKRYFNRNIGAIILASDGIFNSGSNPVSKFEKFRYPVYTIALGDTNIQRDIVLAEVLYNKIAFLGNKFPVKITVDFHKLKNAETKIQIIKDNKVLISESLKSNSDNYTGESFFEIEADKTGLQYYTISVIPVDGEFSRKNNILRIAVDVIDSRQKVLILSNSPHPDIAALKNSIATNINFQVSHFDINDFKGKPEDYNLIIMHQLPSVSNVSVSVFKDIFAKKIPVLFIIGSQTDLKKFNALNIGLQINQRKQSLEESLPELNNDFTVFSIDNLAELSSMATPLVTPFGDYRIKPGMEVLFYQKIKNINTDKPLIFFNRMTDHKTGFISGEGIWKWRLQEKFITGTSERSDIMINKIIQFLALKVNKEKFIVDCKRVFSETENVLFRAELYNENFELYNIPEISLVIEDYEGKNYNYSFGKTSDAYSLDAGQFPVGEYSYKATAEVNNKKSYAAGKFIVTESNFEEMNLKADHKLLALISESTGGQMFYPEDISEIINRIQENENIKAISYIEKDMIELINLKWIFFVLLLIISLEWFLRKYYGSN